MISISKAQKLIDNIPTPVLRKIATLTSQEAQKYDVMPLSKKLPDAKFRKKFNKNFKNLYASKKVDNIYNSLPNEGLLMVKNAADELQIYIKKRTKNQKDVSSDMWQRLVLILILAASATVAGSAVLAAIPSASTGVGPERRSRKTRLRRRKKRKTRKRRRQRRRKKQTRRRR